MARSHVSADPKARRWAASRWAAVAALAALPVLAGCGDRDLVAGDPAERAYDGPLHVDRADATHPSAGAAGDVVDCRNWGMGGASYARVYQEGATAKSPTKALEVARHEGGFGGVTQGLAIAKEEDDRVLYVVEVHGTVKEAVIVHDGPATKGAGGDGWYVESWAHCDYSELPHAFTDSIGLQIWNDADGAPAPTTKIQSWTGAEHCDWQSMTFLTLDDSDTSFVREPQPDLDTYFATPYDAHAKLPADAVDTGYDREGDHLWLSPDKQQAYVGSTDDVEVWPRETRMMGCA